MLSLSYLPAKVNANLWYFAVVPRSTASAEEERINSPPRGFLRRTAQWSMMCGNLAMMLAQQRLEAITNQTSGDGRVVIDR